MWEGGGDLLPQAVSLELREETEAGGSPGGEESSGEAILGLSWVGR